MKVVQFKQSILVYGTLICLCFMYPGLSSAIDTNAALGIWLFDEGNGNTAMDSSNNGNDGELVGAKWVAGKYGEALKFEGGCSCFCG